MTLAPAPMATFAFDMLPTQMEFHLQGSSATSLNRSVRDPCPRPVSRAGPVSIVWRIRRILHGASKRPAAFGCFPCFASARVARAWFSTRIPFHDRLRTAGSHPFDDLLQGQRGAPRGFPRPATITSRTSGAESTSVPTQRATLFSLGVAARPSAWAVSCSIQPTVCLSSSLLMVGVGPDQ